MTIRADSIGISPNIYHFLLLNCLTKGCYTLIESDRCLLTLHHTTREGECSSRGRIFSTEHEGFGLERTHTLERGDITIDIVDRGFVILTQSSRTSMLLDTLLGFLQLVNTQEITIAVFQLV